MTEDQFADLPDGTRICYRDQGRGSPILLVVGLSFQLIHWPDAMVGALSARGHRVIRFDNRDSGRSSGALGPTPTAWHLASGRAPAGAYTLGDMAGDAFGLMDHLGIDRAHLVGMSMGGMIAQVMAARRPDRTISLTSIFSTTGAREVGQPSARMMMHLARPMPRTRAAYVRRCADTNRILAGDTYPPDPAANRALFGLAWDRGTPDRHHGTARQIGAIYASGDRTAEVSGITAPTLVIHGDRDPLVAPSGGTATAGAIAGARHLTIDGMGHDIPPSLGTKLAGLIADHADLAERGGT